MPKSIDKRIGKIAPAVFIACLMASAQQAQAQKDATAQAAAAPSADAPAPDTAEQTPAAAEPAQVHPLRMQAVTTSGQSHNALAFNEVSLLRETRQAAKIRISVDDRVRIQELICDGVLICTPAGSTAYNLSAHGPILPIDAALLALTPISAFRPRRWHGALLPHRARTRFEILEPVKRPVSAVADDLEVRNVAHVDVAEDRSISTTMLFDAGHSLDERILAEQFVD